MSSTLTNDQQDITAEAHQICEEARHVACVCGAPADSDCTCGPDVHLARIVTARRGDWLTGDDVVTAIRLSSRTPGAVLRDPGDAA